MRPLTDALGLEYAYKKRLENRLDDLHRLLETGATGQYTFLCGEIHGIREAIKDIAELREQYKLDDDADFRK